MKKLRNLFLPLSVLLICGMLLVSPATMVPADSGEGIDSGPGSTPWPLFRHDQPHSGRSDYAGTSGPGIKWTYATDGIVMSSPAIGADGTIYVGSMDGYLYAVDPSGSLKWKFATTTTGIKRGINASPAVGYDGTIFVGALDGNLYAVDPDSGLEKWHYTTGAAIMSSCVIGEDGSIYFGSDDTYVYSLSYDGAFNWSYVTGGRVTSSPALDPNGTLYVGSWDGSLYALFTDTGYLKWQHATDDMIISSPSYAVVGTGEWVFFGSYDGKFYWVDAPTGNTTWWSFWPSTDPHQFVSSPALASDGTVYAGCVDGSIYAIDPSTGYSLWSYDTGSPIISSPAVDANGVVYVAAQNGTVYALEGSAGTVTLLWSQSTAGGSGSLGDGVQSSPTIGEDGTIYIGAADKQLYAITQMYTLTTMASPSTAGTVALTPSGGTYAPGTTVQVKANAVTGFVFDHWTGDLTGSTNPVNIVMDGNKSVTAVFRKVQYTLTTAVSPAGAGTVVLTPSGGVYDTGTTVQVKANAVTGYVFDHWTGDLTGTVNPANIVMNGNKSVTAVFRKVQYTLTTAVSPAGAGTVALTPPGGVYDSGTTVQVKANAAAGFVFDHWSGDLTGSTNPANIVMNGNKSVTAVFRKVQYTLTTAVSPAGAGTVVLTPSGGTYSAGTTVQVKANAGANYVFDHWSGDLTGSANPASIVMNGNASVTAVFTTVDSVSIPVPAAPKVRSNGYRMIGIPLKSTSGTSRDVFTTVSPFFGGVANPYEWALYKSNGTTLIAKKGVDTVDYGKGWWIISTKAKRMEIAGKPLTTDFRRTVSRGQNMIACPFSDKTVTWANVVADSANASLLLGANLYYFKNGEYVISRIMEPGKAYWASVGNAGGGTLVIRRSYGATGGSAGGATAADAELEQSPPPLAPGSQLKVLYPAGGTKLKEGSVSGIRWSSSGISPEGFTSRVSIAVSMDGGKTYSLIAEGVPNSGLYQWTVPEGTVRSRCLIRVVSDLYPNLAGTSEREFSIRKR